MGFSASTQDESDHAISIFLGLASSIWYDVLPSFHATVYIHINTHPFMVSALVHFFFSCVLLIWGAGFLFPPGNTFCCCCYKNYISSLKRKSIHRVMWSQKWQCYYFRDNCSFILFSVSAKQIREPGYTEKECKVLKPRSPEFFPDTSIWVTGTQVLWDNTYFFLGYALARSWNWKTGDFHPGIWRGVQLL